MVKWVASGSPLNDGVTLSRAPAKVTRYQSMKALPLLTILRILAAYRTNAFTFYRQQKYAFTSYPPISSLLVVFTTRDDVVASGESVIALGLSKPLGIMLEECEVGRASGVFVKEVSDSGSAASFSNQILGAKLAMVQGQDVTSFAFDDAMAAIIDAPEMVELTFVVVPKSTYNEGDIISVIAQQEGKEDIKINAKVGENLRSVLLENGFEVYIGLKQTLGNCGGGGQCTFCAVDFLESDGWDERSDYEDQKLKRFPDARLSCLNNIQGPVTIRKTQR